MSLEMLSPLQREMLAEINNVPQESPQFSQLLKNSPEKLIPNLNSKIKYIIHFRNLQLYLSLGMMLTKIHRVIKFTQKPLFAAYTGNNNNNNNTSNI